MCLNIDKENVYPDNFCIKDLLSLEYFKVAWVGDNISFTGIKKYSKYYQAYVYLLFGLCEIVTPMMYVDWYNWIGLHIIKCSKSRNIMQSSFRSPCFAMQHLNSLLCTACCSSSISRISKDTLKKQNTKWLWKCGIHGIMYPSVLTCMIEELWFWWNEFYTIKLLIR